jgi:organic hydroperoxide reductase OsmC/OhrA
MRQNRTLHLQMPDLGERGNRMSTHTATIQWERADGDFAQGKYSRRHSWHFDGGTVVAASPSPHVVPAPWSDAAAVDPEEAFVASISSCHMLWFLSLAAERGYVIERYDDDAIGTMARIAPQRQAITEVVLRPRVRYAEGHAADAPAAQALHHAAHERCFIANSVKTTIRIEPRD